MGKEKWGNKIWDRNKDIADSEKWEEELSDQITYQKWEEKVSELQNMG